MDATVRLAILYVDIRFVPVWHFHMYRAQKKKLSANNFFPIDENQIYFVYTGMKKDWITNIEGEILALFRGKFLLAYHAYHKPREGRN